ncbi:MAG: T9SS type A sorting domain-containing protein [Lewinellaceae bacterium]|nr:T9SS type A sorting domain-containing protein [Lewinellaceae bacterium]MCB9332535.1 T9SS type A sorting domain-containing protein [Lewinellaceae bacterium]
MVPFKIMFPQKSIQPAFNTRIHSFILSFFHSLFISVLSFQLFPVPLDAQCLSNVECPKSISLQSLFQVYTISRGDSVEVTMILCFASNAPVDTTVDLSLSIPEGIDEAFVTGGDFSESGEGTANIEGTSDCIEVSLMLYADTSLTPGDLISIPVSVELPYGFCDLSDTAYSTVHLFVIDTENITCKCDSGEGDVNLTGNVLLSDVLDQFNGPGSPPCLSINGSLTVDIDNFALVGSEIILGPGSRIHVRPHSSLYLKANYIHGCDKLWDQISKAGAGMMYVIGNTVEDGQAGFGFVGPTTNITGIPVANFRHNFFNKNFVGISKTNFVDSEVIWETFSGNEFTCENETLLPTGLPIFPATIPVASKSFAGVYIVGQIGSTVNLSGLPNDELNHFHHLQNGIIADAANLIVRNTRFNNIPVNNDYRYTAQNKIGIGYGIHNTTGISQIGQGKSSATPSFDAVDIGIYCGAGNIDISENNMREMKTGVKIRGADGTHLNVSDNTIYCDDVGIDLLNVGVYLDITINQNKIVVDSALGAPNINKGIGINIRYTDEGLFRGEVNLNSISLFGRNSGIAAGLIESGRFWNNGINLNTSIAIAGIGLHGSKNANLYCNTIGGVSGAYDAGMNIGINVIKSLGCAYQCNTINSTSVGIRFSGVCSASTVPPYPETRMRGNSFVDHGYGFMMQSDALFGSFSNQSPHAHAGNTWSGDYEIDRAIHYGFPIQILNSLFQVKTGELPYYPYSDDSNNPIAPMPPTPNALGTGEWFQITDDGSPFGCPAECEQPATGPAPDSVGSFGLAIAQDSLSFTYEFDEAIKETLRRYLFRFLDDNPALINQDSALVQFYAAEEASSGVFTTIDRLKQAALTIDSSSEVQFLLWESAITARLDSIHVAEAEFPAEPDSSDIAAFGALQVAYISEIDSFINLQRQLFCTLLPYKIALIDSAWVLNDGIEPITHMQLNEQIVNQLYLEKAIWGNFNWTTIEKNNLDTIANQCPTLGGNAVFRARSMLDAAGYWEVYNDDSLCEISSSRPLVQIESRQKSKTNILIFPNPASDQINIRSTDPWAANTTILLTDILGNQILCQTVSELTDQIGLLKLPLSTLLPGLYFVQIQVQGDTRISKKIIKI